MESISWWSVVQDAVFLAVVVLLVNPLGAYMTRVFERQPNFLDFIFCPIERLIYKLTRVDVELEMNWREYAVAFVTFSFVGTFTLFLILKMQVILPLFSLNGGFLTAPMTADLAFNTAISFATTTTWQAYGGETTMSYFSQIVGLTVQNFLAGASGLAVGIAFMRGLARKKTNSLGNFWIDLVRGLLWILLPFSVIGSLVLVWQGVPANFLTYTQVATLEGGSQIIAQGPVAVLEFIKNLGTNGGGFFNVNGAHPFENPTPLANFLEMLAIVALPAALTNVFGRMIGKPRQGWVLFWTMTVLFVAGLLLTSWFEKNGNPLIAYDGAVVQQGAGNMEGKETRFGVGSSVLTSIVTSNGATGSYNSMHDSFTPMGGGIPLINMLLGEIIYGAHGLTEIFYAYASAFANNGQNFAGLSTNSVFYNITISIAMIIGRFGLAIPALALGGLFAAQSHRPVTLGTLPTDSWEFGILLSSTALIVGGLSFFPALSLCAILEHLLMLR